MIRAGAANKSLEMMLSTISQLGNGSLQPGRAGRTLSRPTTKLTIPGFRARANGVLKRMMEYEIPESHVRRTRGLTVSNLMPRVEKIKLNTIRDYSIQLTPKYITEGVLPRALGSGSSIRRCGKTARHEPCPAGPRAESGSNPLRPVVLNFSRVW